MLEEFVFRASLNGACHDGMLNVLPAPAIDENEELDKKLRKHDREQDLGNIVFVSGCLVVRAGSRTGKEQERDRSRRSSVSALLCVLFLDVA